MLEIPPTLAIRLKAATLSQFRAIVRQLDLDEHQFLWNSSRADLMDQLTSQLTASDRTQVHLETVVAKLFRPNPQPLIESWLASGKPKQFERIIGEVSTLKPISFLENGLRCSNAVCRIRRKSGANEPIGTGFLTENEVLITNHHVIPTPTIASNVVFEFNYQEDSNRRIKQISEILLAPDGLIGTSPKDDWTFLRLPPGTNEKFGSIPLANANPSCGSFANIIGHPRGRPKEIALYHNLIVYSDTSVVQYLTDTDYGSSGSPVLDHSWAVIALHRGWGQIIGEKGDPKRLCNEGTPVEILLSALENLDK